MQQKSWPMGDVMTSGNGAGIARIPNSVWILALALIGWIFYAGIATGGFDFPIERMPWSILVPGFAGFCFVHSVVMLGHRRAVLLLILCTTFAFASEYIGEATGIIFGPYYYTDVLGPKILGLIPLLIPFAWYMMFYPSYVVTNLLAEGHPVSQGTGTAWILWICALSALVMTAWDLTMDPIMSFHTCQTGTIDCLPAVLDEKVVGHPAWVWTDGGSYFGVPLSNYRGWLLTAFVVFLAYRLLERRLVHEPWPGGVSKVVAVLPVLGYGSMAFIDAWLGNPKVEDVHLISPFAMGIPFLFAAFTLFARNPDMPIWPHHTA
ncbi:MAG: carotenoid biosynthesis protein [Novosphingobium sp.]|uniref:carotenoid biosynthesis protein n=1 Tax=Novosphingobium sp. TaxID=1874826 RepID=UPI0032BD2865